MKFTIDMADEDVAKFVALIQGAEPAAPAAAAPKPPTKPKPATKPATAPVAGPSRDDVNEALRARSAAVNKDDALAILHKYSPTLSGLAEEDFPKVIADLAAPVVEEDSFG